MLADCLSPAACSRVALHAGPALVAFLCGVGLDRWLGEPRYWHPLIGFGNYAGALEKKLNRTPQHRPHASSATSWWRRLAGIAAWCLAVLPAVLLALFLVSRLSWPLAVLAHALLLWFALGAKSLDLHIAPIGNALLRGDLATARLLGARIVSRELREADSEAVARAAVESALENGSDAIFATLFWFLLAGGPGALAFRLINTLDAMWGYRTPRFNDFGWAAARIDDVANWIPARLVALSYTVLGQRRDAWRCWRQQAPLWDSPNAGPVMAAGAGSLGVRLGGAARYHGQMEVRPDLGCGAAPQARDIHRALQLVHRTTVLWVAVIVCIYVFTAVTTGA